MLYGGILHSSRPYYMNAQIMLIVSVNSGYPFYNEGERMTASLCTCISSKV